MTVLDLSALAEERISLVEEENDAAGIRGKNLCESAFGVAAVLIDG